VSSGEGWEAFSYATLFQFVDSKGASLDDDVELCEVQTKGSSLRCRVTENTEASVDVLGKLLHSGTEGTVEKMSFEVYRHGSTVKVEVDKHGVFGLRPSRSAGGLPAERIRRRFMDGIESVDRVRSVMRSCCSRLEFAE